MNNDVVINTAKLTKYYGKQLGIAEVDLTVNRGEVFGYLGPNGAGKTTTIRTLLDFIRPTGGSAAIFGLDARQGSVAIHRRVGYLNGELSLYDDMTGEQLLRYLGNLRGGLDWQYVKELAARFQCDLPRRIQGLSLGNKQKLGLLQAFMHKPELDIDEAIRMGDRVAVLREGGTLAQYATPGELLCAPADDFVAAFVGADRGLKRLGLSTLADIRLPDADSLNGDHARVSDSMTLRDALSTLLLGGGLPLVVVDGAGLVRGQFTLEVVGGVLRGADGPAAC